MDEEEGVRRALGRDSCQMGPAMKRGTVDAVEWTHEKEDRAPAPLIAIQKRRCSRRWLACKARQPTSPLPHDD